MKKYFVCLSLLASFFFSCENVVEVDIKHQDPKLVINGFLNPDSSFAVHVSKSQFVLDTAAMQNVTDARVVVYEGEQKLGDLQYRGDGSYMLAGVFPEQGKEYTLRVEREGFEPVIATEKMLAAIEDIPVAVETLPGWNENSVKLRFTLTLNDKARERNFYLFKGFVHETYRQYNEDGELEDAFTNTIPMYMETPDPNIEEFWINGSLFVLPDTYFDGKPYEVRLNDVNAIWTGDGDDQNTEVYLVVYEISEATYLYYKTLDQNSYSENPFAEPQRVYSNVEGGYGIWASVAGRLIKVEF